MTKAHLNQHPMQNSDPSAENPINSTDQQLLALKAIKEARNVAHNEEAFKSFLNGGWYSTEQKGNLKEGEANNTMAFDFFKTSTDYLRAAIEPNKNARSFFWSLAIFDSKTEMTAVWTINSRKDFPNLVKHISKMIAVGENPKVFIITRLLAKLLTEHPDSVPPLVVSLHAYGEGSQSTEQKSTIEPERLKESSEHSIVFRNPQQKFATSLNRKQKTATEAQSDIQNIFNTIIELNKPSSPSAVLETVPSKGRGLWDAVIKTEDRLEVLANYICLVSYGIERGQLSENESVTEIHCYAFPIIISLKDIAVVPSTITRPEICILFINSLHSLSRQSISKISTFTHAILSPISSKLLVQLAKELGEGKGIRDHIIAYSHEVGNSSRFLFSKFIQSLNAPFRIGNSKAWWSSPLGSITIDPELKVDSAPWGFIPSLDILGGIRAQMIIWAGDAGALKVLQPEDGDLLGEKTSFSRVLDKLVKMSCQISAFHTFRNMTIDSPEDLSKIQDKFNEKTNEILQGVSREVAPDLKWRVANEDHDPVYSNHQLAFTKAILASVSNSLKHCECKKLNISVSIINAEPRALKFSCTNPFSGNPGSPRGTKAVLETCLAEFGDEWIRYLRFEEDPDSNDHRIWVTEFSVPLNVSKNNTTLLFRWLEPPEDDANG